MRLFGGERVQSVMDRMNVDEDMPLENKMLSRTIENSQTSIESRNFQARKNVLEYDDVMNRQREIIYGQRREVLEGRDIHALILGMIEDGVSGAVQSAFSHGAMDHENYREMMASLEGIYFPKYAYPYSDANLSKSAEELTEEFVALANEYYAKKDEEFTPNVMRELERIFMLRTVDEYWMDHIDAMNELRHGIRLRAYGNENPVDAYKRESFNMFEDMVQSVRNDTVRRLFSVRKQENQEIKRERVAVATGEGFSDGTVKKQPRRVNKIGRNDPCPCGSGKKYKVCCGR